MNLASKRARRTLVALCSVGLVAAGGAFGVNAMAASTFTYSPAAVAATVVNIDPSTTAGAPLAYGVKVVGGPSSNLHINELTGPAPLYFERRATAVAPAANPTGATHGVTASIASGVMTVTVGSLTPADTGAAISSGGTITSVTDATHAAVTSGDAASAALTLTPVAAAVTATGSAGSATLTTSIAASVNVYAGHLLKISKNGETTEVAAALSNTGANPGVITLDRNLAAAHSGAAITDLGPVATAAFTTVGSASSAPVLNQAAASDIVYVGGVVPGTYTFQLYNDGASGDNIYDSVNEDATPVFTLTVKDVTTNTVTTSDDLNFALTAPASTGLGQAVTPTVAPALSINDARGLTGGVGTLGANLASAMTFAFSPRTLTDGTTSGGGGLTLTSPTALFSAGDVGATIVGTGAHSFTSTTIASVTSSTVAVLTANSGGGGGAGLVGSIVITPTGAPTFDGTSFSRASGNPIAAGTLTTTVTLGSGAAGTATASTTVADNAVSAVTLAATNVTGAVKDTDPAAIAQTATGVLANSYLTLTAGTGRDLTGHVLKIAKTGDTTEYVVATNDTTGSTTLNLAAPLAYAHAALSTITDMTAIATSVKTATTAVTYTATVVDSDTSKAGDIVTFTLGGTDVASLTTNGTTVSALTHKYSAVTDATGVASLIVTDGAATTSGYTVSAASNSKTSNALTATYGDAHASTATITNSTASLYPAVGTASVTLTGTLKDQFGSVFQPASNASQQVDVTSASIVGTGHSVISAGKFSYVYTPATAPTAGTIQTVTFTYAPSGTTVDAVLHWASTTAASTVTLTTPKDAATSVNLSTHSTIAPGQAHALATDFGSATGEVTGTVVDSGNAGIAYKTVTLTGSPGVYFSTSSTGDTLATTAQEVSDSSGALSGVFAFFTKPGTATVTATVDTKTDIATVTTDDSADPYTVAVNAASGNPGATLVVTGTVKDVFGNVVPSTYVDLGTGTSTIGSLAATKVQTNSAGVFSTTFAAGSNQSGVATLTATLYQAGSSSNLQTANLTPASEWSSVAGLTTLANGVYKSTGDITIAAPVATTVDGPSSRVGAGNVTLSGMATAGAAVDIYSKIAGSPAAYGWVDTVIADSTGAWTASEHIAASTTFIAKTSTSTSASITVTVTGSIKSSVKLTATAIGHGKVVFSIVGSPAGANPVAIYRVDGKVAHAVLRTWTYSNGHAYPVLTVGRGAKTYFAVYSPKNRTASASSSVMVVVR